MAETLIIEGFADTKAGWEFDMPVFMVKPIKVEGIGGSMHYAEDMVEDYLIDLALGDEPESDPDLNIGRAFRAARDGKSTRYVYWRCEVTLPDGDRNREEYWDSVSPGPFHYGPLEQEVAP